MNEQSHEPKTFQYTYSSGDQEEVRKIRSKYMPAEESKLDRLRRLDSQVTRKAGTYALTLGVLGTLILGTGMSCCMVWGGPVFVWGIVIGLAGMAALSLAYPLYGRIVRKEREKIAPEILRLTDELMK